MRSPYLHDGDGLQVGHVLGRQQWWKTFEEEVLDGGGHGIHGYVQAVQVYILQQKTILQNSTKNTFKLFWDFFGK
jgi:hypothetical protein